MGLLNFLSTSHWMSLGPSPIDAPGVGIGLAAGRVEAAAPDPTDANTMYVTGSGGGIWKTGVWNNPSPAWLSLGDDFRSMSCGGYHSIVVHPANHKLIFATASGTGGGILKSSPSTLSFTLMGNSTFEGLQPSSIAVHPTNTSILYVSDWRTGAYKSTDGGQTYQPITTFHKGGASDIVVPVSDPNTVYVGLVPNNGQPTATCGVYKSIDGGATWKIMPTIEAGVNVGAKDSGGNFVFAIRLAAAATSGTVYVSIFAADSKGNAIVKRYHTADGGAHWTLMTALPGGVETRSWHVLLAVDPKNAKHVFANAAYALYHSTDAGQTWASAEPAKPIGDDWVNMSFDANDNWVVTSDQGINIVTKGHWSCRDGNLGLTQFYDVALDPSNPDLIYGIGQDQRAIMKFTGSVEWAYLSTGGETGRLLIDPTHTKRLYVYNPQDPSHWVLRSTDGGATWGTIGTTAAFQPNNYSLAYSTQKSFVMDPNNASRILLGAIEVLETKNASAATPSWKSMGKPSAGQWVTALAIAPSSTSMVYAGTSDGHLWVTTNDGAQWTEVDAGLFAAKTGNVLNVQVDPHAPSHLIVVTQGAVWHLTSIFAAWTNIRGDLPTTLGVVTLFVDWQYSTPAIWIGTTRGVYQSVNLGQNWTKFALDFPNTGVSDLENTASVNVLAGSTGGRGLFAIFIKPSVVSGAVVQALGNAAVASATVFLDVSGKDTAATAVYKTTTNADGRFEFAKVPPGTYTLRVVPPAGSAQTAATTKTLVLNGSNVTQTIEIELEVIVKPPIVVPGIVNLLPGQAEGMPHSAPDEGR